jgi:hypothetical protein
MRRCGIDLPCRFVCERVSRYEGIVKEISHFFTFGRMTTRKFNIILMQALGASARNWAKSGSYDMSLTNSRIFDGGDECQAPGVRKLANNLNNNNC